MASTIVAPIFFIALILILGQVFSATFEKTRVPDALPLMLIGILVGPILHFVEPASFGKVDKIFTEIVLIIVMFHSGAGLRLSSLRESLAQGVNFTVIAILGVIFSTYIISHFVLGFPPLYAIILGSIIADNSLIVVAPLLKKLSISSNMKTILIIEGSVNKIINVILVLALLSMSLQANFSAGVIFKRIFYSFSVAFIIGVVAGIFWAIILKKIRELENANSLSFAFILLVYSLCAILKSEGAIGVLIFGFTIGNIRVFSKLWEERIVFEAQPFKLEEKSFFLEVEYILKTLFFVYIGISMTFTSWKWIVLAFIFMLAKVLSRIPIVNYTLSKDLDRQDISVALAMCPCGLLSAVLATSAAQTLPEGAVIKDIVYSVIFFSFIFCALMAFLIEKGYFKSTAAILFARHKERINAEAQPPAEKENPV